MDHRSPCFEASLLLNTASLPELHRLINQIGDIIVAQGECLVRTDRPDEMFTVLTCGTLQVLLACSPEPLPAGHFLNATRPGGSDLSEHEVLIRLSAARSMVTVLVVDRDGMTAPTKLKRDLCWQISTSLFQATETDMVFWSETDMLYAAEEFADACSPKAAHPKKASAATRIPQHFTKAPIIGDFALEQVGIAPSVEPDPADEAPRASRLQTLLSRAMPTILGRSARRRAA